MSSGADTSRVEPARPPRAPVRIALAAGAVAGLACVVVALAALLFGVTPLLFRSGSMEPAIGTGSVALARTVNATDLVPGDVVSVTNEAGERITHRVTAVDAVSGNTATLRLKGDANRTEDAQTYTVTSAERVFFHAEKLGYALAWLASPTAVFLGGTFTGVLLAIAFRPRRRSPRVDGRHPTTTLVVAAVLLGAGGFAHAPPAQAQPPAGTDAAAATSGALSSRAEFVPRLNQAFTGGTYVTCARRFVFSGPDQIDLTWRHLGGPYRYRVVLRDLDPAHRIWRTWDVTTVPANIGDTVSYTITGAGLPSHPVVWQYDVEIHTVLPSPPISSGAVSTAWRGTSVFQSINSLNEELDCSGRGQQEAGPAYVPPPASLACTTQAPRVTLTWPHLGAPHTYLLTVRDSGNRNVMLTRTVTTVPAQAGQNVTSVVAVADLDLTVRSGDPAIVEVRTINGTSTSAEFVQQNLTVTTTAVACTVSGLRTQSAPATTTDAPAPTVTPTTTPATTTTTTTIAPPPSTTPAPTPSAPAATSATEPTTTTPPPATPPVATTPAPAPPAALPSTTTPPPAATTTTTTPPPP
ncbi:hypothetical protein [Nocardia jiangsuensis]|uniref:Signal peptidase I n=1 Tax=Nocardia jiangsuensis TaxID=1691563 RepID=A0ABV8E0A7_9NOCA